MSTTDVVSGLVRPPTSMPRTGIGIGKRWVLHRCGCQVAYPAILGPLKLALVGHVHHRPWRFVLDIRSGDDVWARRG